MRIKDAGLSVNPFNAHALRTFFRRSLRRGTFPRFDRSLELGRSVLDADPEFIAHREWFRQVLIESAREGNRVVGIRATLGGHWRSTGEFRTAIEAAVQGIREGEEATGEKIFGVLILGIRKSLTADEAENLLNEWLALRDDWKESRPDDAARLYGVDSVGEEIGIDPSLQAYVFAQADDAEQLVAYHIGELWELGGLMDALERIQYIVDHGAAALLTNPIALFVNAETLRGDLYPPAARRRIRIRQEQLWNQLANQPRVLEISPTSNEIMTRALRREEGWRLIPMKTFLNMGIPITVTDSAALRQIRTTVKDFDATVSTRAPGQPERKKLKDLTEQDVIDAMEQHGWTIQYAADALGISRPSMYKLIENNSQIRRVEQIPPEEIRTQLNATDASIEQCASRLKTPSEALRRHLKGLGLIA